MYEEIEDEGISFIFNHKKRKITWYNPGYDGRSIDDVIIRHIVRHPDSDNFTIKIMKKV